MSANHHVTIKGNKDGLVFVLDDQCDFSDLLDELKFKLEKTHSNILSGPIVHVQVKLGSRRITEAEQTDMLTVMKQKGNLIVKSFESDTAQEEENHHLKIMTGMVRSGQTLVHEGSLLFLGDINPGGSIICHGDVYIMGSLRGMAHAGSEGNEQAIIAASHMQPMQLRISGVISRPPDEWGIDEAFMEFAYLTEGKMELNKLSYLKKIRPGTWDFKRRVESWEKQ